MARTSLKTNIGRKPDQDKAAAITRALAQSAAPAVTQEDGDILHETVSYHLPVDLIELCRELAEARLKVVRAEKRKAKREGVKGPEARRSASAVVREALEAYRGQIEAEIKLLKG